MLPTTLQKCQFGAKVLTRCCCCCLRAPTGTFTSADMSIEAHVKRLCRRQCCTACFWHLLRLITLENDEFNQRQDTCDFCDPHGSVMRGLPVGNLRGLLPPRTWPCGGGGRAQERGLGVSEISCHSSMYIRSMTLSVSRTLSLPLTQSFVHPRTRPLSNHSPAHSFFF